MSAPGFPPLRELQTLFWRLIAAPEGVARGAESLVEEGALASEDLAFLIPPGERMSEVERLDVYADMYFYRLRDCLAEDFPKLAAWIGAERWHNLVTDYLLAHPPSHFSLRELGRALPGFVEGHALAGDFPCLAGLTRLEWARVDVFDEADAEPLTRESLLDPSNGAAEERILALVPAARLLSLDRAVLPIWKRLDEARPDDTPVATESTGEVGSVLVWRKGFAIWHRSVPRDEAWCLDALADATATLPRLGELLDEFHSDHREDPDAAPPAERLAALLGGWLRDEAIRLY